LWASSIPSEWTAKAAADQGTVEFKAVGRPSALKIIGKGTGAAGEVKLAGTTVSGVFSFDLNTLDTGIKLRNEHMKAKYLETEKFPATILKISDLVLPEGLRAESAEVTEMPFSGVLLLHGVEKIVQGLASVKRGGKTVGIEARFKIKVSDYSIAVPSFAGITVADEVDVIVKSIAQIQ